AAAAEGSAQGDENASGQLAAATDPVLPRPRPLTTLGSGAEPFREGSENSELTRRAEGAEQVRPTSTVSTSEPPFEPPRWSGDGAERIAPPVLRPPAAVASKALGWRDADPLQSRSDPTGPPAARA